MIPEHAPTLWRDLLIHAQYFLKHSKLDDEFNNAAQRFPEKVSGCQARPMCMERFSGE